MTEILSEIHKTFTIYFEITRLISISFPNNFFTISEFEIS